MVLWILIYSCYAEDLILVNTSTNSSNLIDRVDLACKFYGLSIERLFVGKDQNNRHVIDALNRGPSSAMIITANALPYINSHEVLSSLREKHKANMPVLITGVTPATDSRLLKNWSGGVVVGCESSAGIPSSGFYKVADIRDIALELSGQRIPFTSERIYNLILDKTKESQSILKITNMNNNRFLPIFIKTVVDGHDVFFQIEVLPFDSSMESLWQYESNRFFEVAAFMMFLRYSFGDRCWHSLGDYANLTIDDPWLIEPYGHLNYKRLLEEMGDHNFHTTIAFIPWNYDHSEPDIVSLFRDNPDRFSICIHGNNHDHYEFYKYEKVLGDPWPAKPLDVQEGNIKQALARMGKFRNLTALSYDRVMVFPHGIAPARTLGLLKKHNFIATVNTGNVPLGSHEPADALCRLKQVTLKFENFPSLNRYTPNRTQSDIAIDLFLDNPILFYAHHDFFEDGIDAFNETADMVNKIQPDIKWKSLGHICQQLYLEKLRYDGNYDVLALSSNFILENTHQCDLTYFVRKEESFSFSIKQITVDSQPYSYKKSERDLTLEVSLVEGESRHIFIEYENDLDLASVDVSKNNQRVNRLRRLSDFRDMTLSKNVLGRTISHYYYGTDLYKFGLMRLVSITLMVVILAIFIIFFAWYFRRHRKRQHNF